METIIVQHATKALEVLRSCGIESTITGDLAMTHYGVDTVLQSIEICVKKQAWDAAMSALCSQKEYTRVDHDVADFYHPYKRGAAVFEILALEQLLLHVVDDASFPLVLEELGPPCSPLHATEQIIWPSLPAFLTTWVQLAARAESVEEKYAYMAWADRLIESNHIDAQWCEKNIPDLRGVEDLEALLRA